MYRYCCDDSLSSLRCQPVRHVTRLEKVSPTILVHQQQQTNSPTLEPSFNTLFQAKRRSCSSSSSFWWAPLALCTCRRRGRCAIARGGICQRSRAFMTHDSRPSPPSTSNGKIWKYVVVVYKIWKVGIGTMGKKAFGAAIDPGPELFFAPHLQATDAQMPKGENFGQNCREGS